MPSRVRLEKLHSYQVPKTQLQLTGGYTFRMRFQPFFKFLSSSGILILNLQLESFSILGHIVRRFLKITMTPNEYDHLSRVYATFRAEKILYLEDAL